MKKETIIYYCDVCEAEDPKQKETKIPVVFNTEQTEGRICEPYLSEATIDICKYCLSEILEEGKILNAYGAMGYNKYEFKDTRR